MISTGKRTKTDIMSGVKTDVVKSKFVDNNTVEYTTADGRRVIRLHDTDIITYMPNGKIILNSGGWRTPTTKGRINEYVKVNDAVDVGITQNKGLWYVLVREKGAEVENEWGKYHPWNTVQVVPFVDGIEIYRGRVMAKYVKKSDAVVKKQEALKKKINGYMKHVQKALEEGNCIPNGGDCWYCLMQTSKGDNLGDAMGDNSHIMSHIKEGYVPAALIWNAVKEAGYKPEYHLHPELMKNWGNTKKTGVPMRAVRKYLKKRLALSP